MNKNRREMHVKKIDSGQNASRESAGSKQTPAGRHPAASSGAKSGLSWPGPQAGWEKFGEMVPPSPRQNQTHAHGSHTTTTRAKIKLDFSQNRPAPNDDDDFSRSTPVIPPNSQHVQANEEGRNFRQGM
jgi:hypothetical protein